MNKVKIKDVKSGAIMEVKESLVADYVGTGRFVIAKEAKEEAKPKNNSFRKEE